MRRFLPWLRTVVSLPLGIVAIMAFHQLMAALVPRLYAADLDNTADRIWMLVLTVLAGIIGSAVVALIARHRLWLHMALFLVVMLVIDILAVAGYLAPQPLWFKALTLLSLPLQAATGGWIAKRLSPAAFAPAT
jgi:zinc transporter ZupT